MGKWIIGLTEISRQAGYQSDWYAARMLDAGLKYIGKRGKGCEVRTKEEWIDAFFDENPEFTGRGTERKIKCRSVIIEKR